MQFLWSGPCLRQVEGREGANLLFSLTINEIGDSEVYQIVDICWKIAWYRKSGFQLGLRDVAYLCKSQIHVERQIDWWIRGQKEYEAVAIIEALTLNFCVKYKHNSQLKFIAPNWRTQSFKLAYDWTVVYPATVWFSTLTRNELLIHVTI